MDCFEDKKLLQEYITRGAHFVVRKFFVASHQNPGICLREVLMAKSPGKKKCTPIVPLLFTLIGPDSPPRSPGITRSMLSRRMDSHALSWSCKYHKIRTCKVSSKAKCDLVDSTGGVHFLLQDFLRLRTRAQMFVVETLRKCGAPEKIVHPYRETLSSCRSKINTDTLSHLKRNVSIKSVFCRYSNITTHHELFFSSQTSTQAIDEGGNGF